MAELAAWLQTWLYVPALGIFVTLLPQLFPTGRPLSRRWYPAVGLAGLACLGVALADALRPGRLDQSTIINPFGITPSHHTVLANIAGPALLLAALVAFASLVVRWRHADAIERQQLKWFAYVGALLPLFLVANALVRVFGLDERINVVGAFLGFLALPIATAVSILCYRLYDIDLIISRTLVYGGLTLILLASYLALVLIFQFTLSPLTEQSDLAVAGSTLAVAALFRPLRARVQAAVDRGSTGGAMTTDERWSRSVNGCVSSSTSRRWRGTCGLSCRTPSAPVHVSLWLPGAPAGDRRPP